MFTGVVTEIKIDCAAQGQACEMSCWKHCCRHLLQSAWRTWYPLLSWGGKHHIFSSRSHPTCGSYCHYCILMMPVYIHKLQYPFSVIVTGLCMNWCTNSVCRLICWLGRNTYSNVVLYLLKHGAIMKAIFLAPNMDLFLHMLWRHWSCIFFIFSMHHYGVHWRFYLDFWIILASSIGTIIVSAYRVLFLKSLFHK